MSGCAQGFVGLSGTAKGIVKNHKDMGRLVLRAIGQIMVQGTQKCIGGTCDSGGCSFGVTRLSDNVEVVQDVQGKGVTVTVTADGECFCG